MTLLKAFGFDNWTEDDYRSNINSSANTLYFDVGLTDRYGGTGAIRTNYGTNGGTTFLAQINNPIICGFATTMGNVQPATYYVSLEGRLYTNVRLICSSLNYLAIQRLSGTTYITQHQQNVNFNNWNFIEIEHYPHETNGYIEVRLNGVQIYYDDTDGYWFNNYLGSNIEGESHSLYFKAECALDDLYILEKDATVPNDFLGEMNIKPIHVTANGTTNDGVASAGSNYECVDETAHNDDTDYVTLDAVNEIELYEFEDISVDDTVLGIITRSVCKKDSVGARSIRHLLRINGTNYDNGYDVGLVNEYDHTNTHFWALNPDDSQAWESTDINALQAGIKVTA